MNCRARLAGAVAFVCLFVAACGTGALRERLRPASPREQYVAALERAGLATSAVGRDWVAAGARALAAPAEAALPLREEGAFAAEAPAAVAWQVRPRRGERMRVRIDAQADSGTRLFAELFARSADTTAAPRLVASADSLRAGFEVDADRGESYILRLQPELLRPVRWTVTLEGGPSLAFPVEGRDSRAVRSLWGVDRDAGARRHEGIDIFAPRGTPVLAAGGGVADVRENPLGGRVVFVRDPARGQSAYYAHLDSQHVRSGAVVRAGDTVGFVGNTGNARTTPPHLHFGIYRRGEGAVDPFPFVDTRVERPAAVPPSALALAGRQARSTPRTAVLRAGPSARTAAVREVPRHTVVAVDGAGAAGAGAAGGGWLRVRLPDRTAGYLPAGALESTDRPVGRERLAEAAAVRAAPSADAVALHVVARATEAPVFGRFGAYTLVETADGARGWVGDRD